MTPAVVLPRHPLIQSRSRLEALAATELLDSPPDKVFDGITSLARRLTGAPVSFLSLVDSERDFYLSSDGFPEPLKSARELRGETFCHHAIGAVDYLAIEDARADPKYRNVPTVTSLGVVAYLGVPLRLSSGHTIGALCVIDFVPHVWNATDIEVLRQLVASATREIEIRQAVAVLHAVEQERRFFSLGHMAAKMAHEFNNVLMSVEVFGTLVSKSAPSNPLLVNASKHVQSAIKRGRSITSQILKVSRPVSVDTSPVGVTAWLEATISDFRATAPAAVNFVTDLSCQDLFMRVEAIQMQQVLHNLLSNAVASMPDGGTVTIRAEDCLSDDPPFPLKPTAGSASFVHFTVEDEGCGIAAAQLPQIFDPFFSMTTGGAGLGLVVVQQVIASHGGQTFVESEVGRGTRFHVLVPRDDPPPEAGSSSPREAVDARHWRVLIVEDEEAIRVGLVMLLEAEGMTVLSVSTGGEAQDAIGEFSPEVVVLDVSLPDISGFDVYSRLRLETTTLPVIFSSGHADQSGMPDLANDPFARFLAKPYPLERLLEVIAELQENSPSLHDEEGGRSR